MSASAKPFFLLLVCMSVGSAVAAEPDPKQLASQARAVLKQHCHRCHGVEFEVETLNVLDLKTLLEGTSADGKHYLVRGKPGESYLLQRVSRGSMPPKNIKERPSQEDRDILERWIQAGAPPFPTAEARPFLSTKAVLTAIRDDLARANRQKRGHLRYFTLTHLHNNPQVAEADLRLVRAALSKALNSLSWKPDILVPRAIDKEQTILAADVSELDWDRDDLWRAVMKEYPYGLKYDKVREQELRDLDHDIASATDCDLPYVRADWFVVTASRPPLYHTLLQLPTDAVTLETRLGVNVLANFREGKLARAGFPTSGVSAQNRMVERHASLYGAYWKSYDFKARTPRNVLTRFPLGPEYEGHPFPRQAFNHAGGELIFHLPNGLQGYLLIDQNGRRIDLGPTDIVSDALKTSGTPAIANGLSCMACHKHGMIPFQDAIRAGTAVGGDALLKVQDLYPPREDMNRLVRKDETKFMNALEQAIGPFLKVAEDKERPLRDFSEPVGEIARSYLLVDLGLAEVAYELGLEKPEQLKARIEGNRTLRALGMAPLAHDRPIKRDEWETIDGYSLFQEVARQLEIGTPLRLVN